MTKATSGSELMTKATSGSELMTKATSGQETGVSSAWRVRVAEEEKASFPWGTETGQFGQDSPRQNDCLTWLWPSVCL